MGKVKALKQVSEGLREREVFKYGPSLSITSRVNDSGLPFPTNELCSSSDTVLTALAQLGACQTNTERSFISLFDAEHQYTVAEATREQPLCPSLPGDEHVNPLWLCGTSIPRSHGVCELPLLGDPSPFQESNPTHDPADTLPLTLSDDLTKDARFQHSPFCQPGSSARFYAAVPIRTRRGINIGVFCVMDSTPGKAWRDADTVRLHDISQTIMGHLETQRLKELHRKSERMNRGMASFIEGKPAIYDKCESGGDTNAILEKVEEEVTEAAHPDGSHSKVGSSKDIFSKAAKIICQSAEVESCFFFDATMESYRVPSLPRINPLFASSRASATSSSDESLDADQLQVFPCSQVLGCSLSEDADLDRTTYRRPDSLIPEQFLGKLLQRYPHGKIFNFGADGELQSSDSSEDEITHAAASPGLTESFPRINLADGSTAPMKPPSKPWSRKNEGNIILQAFPTARSVAFVPIWDPKKERWFAGGFICTENPSRALTISNDMSYLRAFGTLAMVEVLRLQTSQADKAKSDVLGSMSHELRSPLHGILLSADLLLDTNLDVFQGNAAHTIETCSRTLLDTIDHLLDFSKVNHFATRKSRANQVDKPVTGVDWRNFGKKSLFSNCRLDSLVEEVVESVFAGFTYQHSPERRMRSGSPVPTGGDTLHVDTLSATDGELQFKFADVSVFLSIDPRRDWMYCVQVGAFRRIIMNILGNALKYTRQGSVKISLTQEHVVHNRLKPDRVIRFTVQDTGKGIGPEFLKHGLYRPFSQEDTFAPGTGLGLSLVKRITSQLAGHIAVESQVGVGTTVTVDLPLEPVPKASAAEFLSEDDREFDELLQDLRGLRVKIMSYSGIADGGSLDDHRKQIEAICTQWLHMEVITDKNAEIQPDMIVWTHEALPKVAEDIKLLAAAPNIVVCSNSLEAYRQSQSFESDGHFGIFEFISQPTGPRKLAKTMLLAYRRWMSPTTNRSKKAGASSMTTRPEGPRRLPSTTGPASVTPPIACTPAPISHVDSTSETEAESIFSRRYITENDSDPSSNEALPSSPTDPEDGRSPALELTLATPIPEVPLLVEPRSQFLLVDDNHINLKLLSAYMKKMGLKYQIAMNGKEALDTFAERPQDYACILMDISMPVMDGFEATRQIRARESKHGLEAVCIIALSGLASEDAHREAFGSGMDLFLTKPVKLKSLGSLLESRGLMKRE